MAKLPVMEDRPLAGQARAGPAGSVPERPAVAERRRPPTSVPFGLAIADMFAGAHLAQGILACLVRRGVTGEGGRVEISLMESILDYQFEVLTTHLNDGGLLPQRSAVNNAHAYLGAP